MKNALLLFILTTFVLACSESKTLPSERGFDRFQTESYAPQVESSAPQAETKSSSTESTVKGFPPRPVTKGLYDFSECKAKYKVGTEDYKGCVKAKYSNIKFAGEER